MKVKTIEQFKVMEFIKANFSMECVELEILDSTSIGLTDKEGKRVIFKWENGEIKSIFS